MTEQADTKTAAKRRPGREVPIDLHGVVREIQAHAESDAMPIRPERLCAEFTKHVPDDGIVLVDTGHAGMWMGGMYDCARRRRATCARPATSAGPFPRTGAKCACPERPVVVFTGDAGFWYHVAEIETRSAGRSTQ